MANPNPKKWGKSSCDKCNSRYGIWGHQPTDSLTCKKCAEKKRKSEISEEEYKREMARRELDDTTKKAKHAKESEEETKRNNHATDAEEETKRLKHAKDSEEETKRVIHEKDVEERIKENEAKNKVTLKQLDVKNRVNEIEAKAIDLRIEEERTKQTQAKEENQTKRAEAIEATKQLQAEEETKMMQAQGEVMTFRIQMLGQFQVVTNTLENYQEAERKTMFAALMNMLDIDVPQAKGRFCVPPIQEQYYA